jgi:hypothetical protein
MNAIVFRTAAEAAGELESRWGLPVTSLRDGSRA